MIGKDTKVWRCSAKQNCTKAGAYFCYFDTIEHAVYHTERELAIYKAFCKEMQA